MLKLKLLLLLSAFVLFTSVNAEDKYSFRVGYGVAVENSLANVVVGSWDTYEDDLSAVSIDIGYLLYKDIFDLPIDIYAKVGLSYYDEDSVHSNIYEGTIYIKAYYNLDLLDNRVRFGLGEGISRTSNVLYAELLDTKEKNDNTSKFLNYLDISIDFDLGKLVNYKPLYGTYFGYAVKHRSGIFGLINNVKDGGSNYNTIYIESNF